MIRVKGQETELRYTWQSVRRLFTHHGIDLVNDNGDRPEATPDTVTAIIWAGILHAVPDATLDDVDFDLEDMNAITEEMNRKLTGALGVKQDDADPLERPQKPSPVISNADSTD